MKFHKHIITIPLVFLIGAISGSIAYELYENEAIMLERPLRISAAYRDPTRFTSPLLDCTELNDRAPGLILDVRDRVRDLIKQKKASGEMLEAAVYFRDLDDGPWFGLDEKTDYSPASLLKVPLMMAIYRQAQLQPGFLDEEVKVDRGTLDEMETYKPSSSLKKGDVKTVRDILGYMIKYSDNNAVLALTKTIDRNVLLETYKEMGVQFPDDANYQISVKNYASFFRVLYNATLLGQDYSEQALKLLSESDFNDGLVAGLPRGVRIAHKFGEREIGDGKKQLHDCGIVYTADPYILCVMTRGEDYTKLAGFISQTSKIVFDTLNTK